MKRYVVVEAETSKQFTLRIVRVKDFYGRPHEGVRVVATIAEADGFFMVADDLGDI